MAVWIYAASWPAWFGLNTLCKSHSLNKKIKIVWAFAGILSASQVACVTEAAGQQGRDRPSFTGAQVESGRQIYVAQCASCHGNELQGGAGPALSGVTFRRGWFEGLRALDEMFDTIYQRMPPSTVDTVSEADALDLIAYVLERNGLDSGAMALNRQALNVRLALGTDAGALAPRAAGATAARDRPSSFPAAPTAFSPARRSVPDDQEILEILDEDWLTAHRDLRGQRFSPLAQITSGNVGRLVPSCLLQLGDSGSFQTSPVAYQGRLYVTTKHKTIAIDAVSCIRLWEHTYVPTDPEPLPGNRGVALYRGKVIRGTTDGHLPGTRYGNRRRSVGRLGRRQSATLFRPGRTAGYRWESLRRRERRGISASTVASMPSTPRLASPCGRSRRLPRTNREAGLPIPTMEAVGPGAS